nr:MAG TPA: Tetrahydromethanopterin S-methyltransferase, F subunit (MtrF) [Caudoviricetes sp.]
MDKRLSEIQTDCQRIARTNGSLAGAVSGAVSGGVVATGIAFIRAKFGF